MKRYNVIKLNFLTPLHIGTGKENYDFSSSELHSDTLTAALAAIKVQQMDNSNEIEQFLSSFRLSSAFPYAYNSYYLPRPMGLLQTEGNNDALRKRLKAVKYLEKDLWSNYVQGEKLEINETVICGEFMNKGKDAMRPYINQVAQRVTVPRCENADAEPFFFNWCFFHKDAGLYCITDAKDELFKEIIQLFTLLGELGIGTDRNIGGGKFEVETDEIELPEVQDANATMMLSLYLPTETELPQLSLEKSRYNLTLRGGYMAGSNTEELRHLWKKNIYMFDVGSVFFGKHTLVGKIVDLRPDWNEPMHPVYRSGKPFCLPIKI